MPFLSRVPDSNTNLLCEGTLQVVVQCETVVTNHTIVSLCLVMYGAMYIDIVLICDKVRSPQGVVEQWSYWVLCYEKQCRHFTALRPILLPWQLLPQQQTIVPFLLRRGAQKFASSFCTCYLQLRHYRFNVLQLQQYQ